MRARQASVASTGDTSRVRICAASAVSVSSVTARLRPRRRLAGRRRARVERGREARRLLADRQVAGRPLDRGRQVGDRPARASFSRGLQRGLPPRPGPSRERSSTRGISRVSMCRRTRSGRWPATKGSRVAATRRATSGPHARRACWARAMHPGGTRPPPPPAGRPPEPHHRHQRRDGVRLGEDPHEPAVLDDRQAADALSKSRRAADRSRSGSHDRHGLAHDGADGRVPAVPRRSRSVTTPITCVPSRTGRCRMAWRRSSVTASAARVSGATVWTGLDIQLATGAAVMANAAMLS